MLRAHSTRGIVSSVGMEAGIDWSAVQAVAGRAGDQTSKRFCHRVVTSRSVTEAVLCGARIVCLGRPPRCRAFGKGQGETFYPQKGESLDPSCYVQT